MQSRDSGRMEDKYDWILASTFVALVMMGLVMVLSSSAPLAGMRHGDPLYYFKRQLLFLGIGAFAFVLSLKVPFKVIKGASHLLLAMAVILLILVLLPPFGRKVGVAQRWLHTPLGSFQPSELAKLALVIFLCHLGTKEERRSLRGFLLPLGVIGLVVGLMLLEPDFGGALFIGGLSVVLMFIFGWRVSHILVLPFLAMPAVGWLLVTKSYAWKRLVDFFSFLRDPSQATYQLRQSFIALARGGILGTGIGAGKQKLFYLPAAHTDFILANLGEELGFAGVLAVMVLFAIVLLRGMRIAFRHPDPFGRNLAAGLTLMIVLQALVNIAVVLGMLPTKGLPLPFLSYGGSSLLVEMVAAGLLLNLSRDLQEGRRKRAWRSGW